MPIIGEDCDLIMVHPDVNSGDPYGFVLTLSPNSTPSAVSIQREIDADGVINIYLFFSIILADDLHNPDGSEHADNRATMYNFLLNYLSKTSGITIGTVMGSWLGIGPLAIQPLKCTCLKPASYRSSSTTPPYTTHQCQRLCS